MRRFNYFTDIDLKIDPENIKRNVNAALNAEPSERKMYMKYKAAKTALIAAAVTAIAATSVFAMSSTGQKFIGNVISYFNNDQAVELTDIEELAKYNEAIGSSDTNFGYTLTLDNVAADDNYLHVFYTLEFDAPKGGLFSNAIYCRLNGAMLGESNNNDREGYLLNDTTYKGVMKFNVSTMDFPDTSTLELIAFNQPAIDAAKAADRADDEIWTIHNEFMERMLAGESISDDDRKNLIYITAQIHKSDIRIETNTVDADQYIDFLGSTLEKVILSPFGNQLVFCTELPFDKVNNEKDYDDMIDSTLSRIDNFALYDNNGTCLDVVNVGINLYPFGKTKNSFEFLKADTGTRQLKLVPVNFTDNEGSDPINRRIGTYPLEYKISEYGRVVITDIRISDGKIEIDYYKDGFVIFDPGFYLTDNNGNNAEPGGKLGCTLYTRVHHDTNSYTAEYVYDDYDENGDPIPADESVSAENLRKNFTTLGVYTQHFFKLDFDKAVTMDLK